MHEEDIIYRKQYIMAGFFLKPSNNSTRGHSRSISLPVRSHPTTMKIEQDLNNLILNLQSSMKSDKLCVAISGLSELYKSVQEVLKLPQTQQSLSSSSSSSSWVDELLEEPLSFLDLCGKTRDSISLLRETMANLQSSLRRIISSNNNNNNVESLTHYISSLKASKREMVKSLSSLKNIDTKLAVSLNINSTTHDEHLGAVVRVMRETSLVSSIVFRALLGYLGHNGNNNNSSSTMQPMSKWSLVLNKLVKTKGGRVDDDDDDDDVEAALNRLMMVHKDVGGLARMVQSKVQVVEKIMEGLEIELEGLFRQLIQMRVALLNILSDH